MKEFRVYVNDMDLVPTIILGEIHTWNDLPELNDDAQQFITLAENEDRVYTLESFQEAFNQEEISEINDFIFITNKW